MKQRWIDFKVCKTVDNINIAKGNGIRHPVLIRSSKHEYKTGPGGKTVSFKTSRFSDQVDKHHRGYRGHGGYTLPIKHHIIYHIVDDMMFDG
jgi:hypothetical protein